MGLDLSLFFLSSEVPFSGTNGKHQIKVFFSPLLCGFPSGWDGKAPACSARDPGLIPGLGRSLGERNGNPLQYSCLENPMDWGAWWATVHGVPKTWTQLSDFTFTFFSLLKWTHDLRYHTSWSIFSFALGECFPVSAESLLLLLFSR